MTLNIAAFLREYLFSGHLPSRIASWGIVVLMFLSVVFIAQILISRIVKTRYDRLKAEAATRIEALLTDFVFDEEHYSRNSDRYRKLVADLKKDSRRRYSRKILVQVILSLHRSLRGDSEDRLQHLYIDLKIKNKALQILRDGEWYEKAFIIKELSQMNAKEALPVIMKYINHYNRVLREEAQFAAVNLGGLSNLDFLLTVKNPISEWQQTRILQQLEQYFHNQLPSFYYLLKAENDTVVIFALKLINYFRQMGDFNDLIRVFKKDDEKIRLTAIDCMMRLEEADGSEFLRQVFAAQSRLVQIRIIEALGVLGSDNDYVFLSRFLRSPDYGYAMAAARSLLRLGFAAPTENLHLEELNNNIFLHAQNEILA
jgi:HEAT repeat protein